MSSRQIVDGRYIEFPDKRVVFVGRLDPDDSIGVGFRNSEGEITKFRLSFDAADALRELLANPIAGTFTADPAFLRDEKKETIDRWTAIVSDIAAVDLARGEASEASDDR